MTLNKSGTYVEIIGKSYKAFHPSFLPIDLNIDNEINKLLIEAHKLISEINTLSIHIPNKQLFISSYIRKEAIYSSQIEGTQCSLADLLDPNIEENTNVDKLEVINYINALEYAIGNLKKLPLSSRLFKSIHLKLLNHVRGEEKNIGEYRKSQNWIGGTNSNIKTASFIPPDVDYMNDAMTNLEKYINSSLDDYDILIKAALVHYQFETIHPFLDGNGRIGRILIILYFLEKNVLDFPIIYISYFLKKQQFEYYMLLQGVRKQSHYEQWIKFFLKSIVVCCNETKELTQKLIELFKNDEEIIKNTKGNKNLFRVFNFLKANPITNITILSKKMNLTYKGTSKIVKKLENQKILVETTNKKKFKTYTYKNYLDLLKKE